MMHFPGDGTPHMDVDLIPLRPPTSGSEGLVLINQNSPPLVYVFYFLTSFFFSTFYTIYLLISFRSEMKIWIANNWKPVFAPFPITYDVRLKLLLYLLQSR